ncbi:MAG: glutamine synthetase family protein [Candidatus Beckwithbacteria bacterium]
MKSYSKKTIKVIIKKEGIKIIALHFTDLSGHRREVCYPAGKIDDVFAGKVDFDGSSVKGFLKIDEGTLSLKPDLSTFRIDPWSTEPKFAIMISDVIDPTGKLYSKATRTILKKAIKHCQTLKLGSMFGVEMEFYFLKEEKGIYKLADTADYCEYPSTKHVFYKLLDKMEDFGIDSEPSIHEHGPSMYEIHFAPDNPLSLADKVFLFKDLTESLAEKEGLKACFMPKPFSGLPGNGMHIHVSMWKNGENIFFTKEGNKFSKKGFSFLAGVMEHTRALSPIFAPTLNSYKRLVPGFEAPCNICWGYDNRSTTFRISPISSAKNAKLEFRAPDMSCDPYLTFAGVIMSGLHGLDKKLTPPKETKGNVYKYTPEKMKKSKIKSLPIDLREALNELKKDKYLMNFFKDAG